MSSGLELLKIIGPALIVFITVYYMLNKYFANEKFRINSMIVQEQNKQILPLKLQAYERLALFLERIKISNLILRIPKADSSNSDWINTLMLAAQQEFEHNLVQQVYVSDQLWSIINLAKDEVLHDLHSVAEKSEGHPINLQLVSSEIVHSNQYISKALNAIKQEVKMVLN